MEIVPLAAADPKDALVIIAYPTPGAAAPIAGHYLIETLKMPLVAHMTGKWVQGFVHVENGVVTSPVRIHGGQVACELDKPCQNLYVITTEAKVIGEGLPDMATAILDWAKDAALVLCLDAVVRDEDDDTPDVYTAATSPEALAALAPTGATSMARASIGGMSAEILAAAQARKQRAALMLVEARQEHPDGRAAAAMIQKLDKLIPQIVIDTEPLLEDAKRIEKMVAQAMKEAEAAERRLAPQPTFI